MMMDGAKLIIGLQGYAGSGKSTVADYLATRYGFARRHIKQTLADMFDALLKSVGYVEFERRDIIDGAMKRDPIPELGGRTSTEIQQFLGTEFGREFIHPDLWVNIWKRWADAELGHVVHESCRFENEADACDAIWEIRRPGVGALSGHASEALPVEYPDEVIENDGDIAALRDKIDRIMMRYGISPARG